MPRTDDLRIREMKELTPPSHLIREFACSDAAEQTAASSRVALHRILHGQDVLKWLRIQAGEPHGAAR